uniref:Putative secreted protein n=1 Tax=Anopheles triannulatus TaxID=58253 RepID=A0A2M4B1D3_9DIPT
MMIMLLVLLLILGRQVPLGYGLIVSGAGCGRGRCRRPARARMDRIPAIVVQQPRMVEHVIRSDALLRIPPEQRSDHAACLRRETLRHRVLAPAYLGEQRRVLGIVKWIPADQHRVEDDTEGPHIGRFARVGRIRTQQLRRHVGGTAPLVLQQILGRIVQHDRIL